MNAITYLIICAALIIVAAWVYNCWTKYADGLEMAIEPCKLCGANGHLVGVGCDSYVRCSSPACAVQGPYGKNCVDAVLAWNNLPSMTTIVSWQFQAAGLALENQRLIKRVGWLAGQLHTLAIKYDDVTACPQEKCHPTGDCVECWKEAARQVFGGKA